MKRTFFLAGALATILSTAPLQAWTADFSLSVLGGYSTGLGVRVTGTVREFAQGFPFALELGISYAGRDPGDPLGARRLFINDNTDGTPQESGTCWDFRLDFQHRTTVAGLKDAYLFLGVRYLHFNGNFDFVGGNETFDVTSNQWGLGLGGKASFPMNDRLRFVLTAGLDYYFDAMLQGHDTSYSPNGESVNGRNDYTYDDADAVINQPKLSPLAMVGISYTF